jgi:hypothetical protein
MVEILNDTPWFRPGQKLIQEIGIILFFVFSKAPAVLISYPAE